MVAKSRGSHQLSWSNRLCNLILLEFYCYLFYTLRKKINILKRFFKILGFIHLLRHIGSLEALRRLQLYVKHCPGITFYLLPYSYFKLIYCTLYGSSYQPAISYFFFISCTHIAYLLHIFTFHKIVHLCLSCADYSFYMLLILLIGTLFFTALPG